MLPLHRSLLRLFFRSARAFLRNASQALRFSFGKISPALPAAGSNSLAFSCRPLARIPKIAEAIAIKSLAVAHIAQICFHLGPLDST
jgi:hypothetical protein